jgi:hypothetical protein
MIVLAYLALLGIPCWALSHVLAQRASPRSVATVMVFGWLFMPLLRLEFSGLPEIDKGTLLYLAVLAGLVLSPRVGGGRVGFRWFDVPVALLCLAPLPTSLANDLGFRDGVSGVLRASITFGMPYAIGRLVFRDAKALRELGRAMFVGAAAYAPFCLFESRMAPQLHQWIFGIPGRVGWEMVEFYGPLRYKASVFLESPLELTPLMGLGVLAGWRLWRVLGVRRLFGFDIRLLLAAAVVAMLMGKSLGGVTLTIVGFGCLAATSRWRTPLFCVALMLVPPMYFATRASGFWDGMFVVDFLRENVSAHRADSLLTRVENENILVAKALERPVFGWGGWGRNRVYDEEGKDISITDGFWVITLGVNGWFGLGSWLVVVSLPLVLALARWRRLRPWRGDGVMLAWAAVGASLHAVDCIANSMINPFYYMFLGAAATVAIRGAVAVAGSAEPLSAPAPSRRAPLHPRRRIAPLPG